MMRARLVEACPIASTTDASDHPLLVSDGQATYLSWMTKADGYRLLPIGDGS